MEEEDRGRVWLLYGWFSGLMACGSCIGAVAWTARMIGLEIYFKGNVSPDPVEKTSLVALAYRWQAFFLVTYAMVFLCLSTAKLMVLDRMSVFAAPPGTRLQKRWTVAGRVVMAVVVLGNAVGLAANVRAAVHYQKAAEAMSTASAYLASNNTKDFDDLYTLSREEVQRGGSAVSVQSFCEVAVLLLIVIAFVVVGVFSARRVSLALREVEKMRGVRTFYNPGQAESRVLADATMRGTALRLQVVGTSAFVFVAFVVRAAFATMYAVAYQLRDASKPCPTLCDPSCRDVYFLITQWMNYTPEFQLMIVLVSSPLAMLVALWGMTPKATLQLMKSKERETLVPLTTSVQNVLRK
jgi:hypothetical protein